jgi:hypothetical protein
MNRRTRYFILFAVILASLASLPVSWATYKVIRWKMYIWLPGYLLQMASHKEHSAGGTTHIVFLFVDHYEPGRGQAGADRSRKWLAVYRSIADRHRDSDGRKPQHTWFYAYDHHNEDVMAELSRTVGEGYGEIEFHWHHGSDDNSSFAEKLSEAVRWFNKFGALVDANGVVSFGFIHGNWSLDNSRGRRYCGVTREMEILKKAGCYADFTFPSFGQVSQPSQPNTIFYARDDDDSKSYCNHRLKREPFSAV